MTVAVRANRASDGKEIFVKAYYGDAESISWTLNELKAQEFNTIEADCIIGELAEWGLKAEMSIYCGD